MFTIRYKDKSKTVNLDRRSNLSQVFQSLFNIKSRIYGVVDSQGNYQDIQKPLTNKGAYTIVVDEPQLQSSLKYSQISEFGPKLHFIDFIYDLEEFQNILSGDSYTCIYLIEERDPLGIDFLSALEPLVNSYNSWISFYYTFHNRVGNQSEIKKLLWVYRGGKKIVQIQLYNDKKMRQMDELLQKLVQAKLLGHTQVKSQNTSKCSNASPNRRSKSIRRIVEEAQQPSRVITRVQAKFTHRVPSAQDYYDEPIIPHQGNSYIQSSGHPQYEEEEIVPHQQSQDSLLSNSDQLYQLIYTLENQKIIDLATSRIVKRLLLEENKEIIHILQGYQSGQFNARELSEQLSRILENTQEQQRPTSPFQGKPQSNHKDNKDNTPTSAQLKSVVLEQYKDSFTTEQFGMSMILLNDQDPVIHNLLSQIYQKIKKGEVPLSLVPLQVYSQNKYNILLQSNFSKAEQQFIEANKNNRTNAVFAIVSCLRYEHSQENFITGLKQALNCSKGKQPQNSEDKQQITLFTRPAHPSPKAPAPSSILMPGFNLQSEESRRHLEDDPPVSNIQPVPIKLPQQRPHAITQSAVVVSKALSEPDRAILEQRGHHRDKQQSILSQIKSAKEEIFDEEIPVLSSEQIYKIKIQRRKEKQENMEQLYNTQLEADLESHLDDLISQLQLDENEKLQVENLFRAFDNELYDIIRNFQSFGSISTTKREIDNILKEDHQIRDYRKQKLFNLFINPVRQFTIQKHLQDFERDFLFQMFQDGDLQVFGTLETYLQNSDAQDMLENLQMIVKQYQKFLNIQNVGYQIPRKDSAPKVKISIKDMVNQFKIYLSGDERLKLESCVGGLNQLKIDQFYEQYLKDNELSSFIQSLKNLVASDMTKSKTTESKPNKLWIQQQNEAVKQHLKVEEISSLLRQLKAEGKLQLDNFLIELICKKMTDSKVKGIFELYQMNKNQEDLIDSLKIISKMMQTNLILESMEEFAQTFHWDQEKLNQFKLKVTQQNSIVIGAFSVYFTCADNDKEFQKAELVDTLERLPQ